jgi:hypothetical protein
MALVCKTNPRLEASTSWGVIVSIGFGVVMSKHYIHGDQSSNFYCSSNQNDKCRDHWAKYDAAIKLLGNSPKKHIEFGRSINSVNVFTAKS